MDPMTVGAAVAALIGAQAVDGFAAEAGTRAWDAVQSMAGSIRARLSSRGKQALTELEAGRHDPSTVDILADEVQVAVVADPTLREILENLIAQAEESRSHAAVIAVARDNARQVNIGGDNSGTINMG
jgi:transcriptional regulator